MTTEELAAVLQGAAQALRTNQEIVTPEMLDSLGVMVNRLQEEPTLLAAIASVLRMDAVKIVKVLPRLKEVLAFERKLIGGLGTKTADGLERLSKRTTLVLPIIAKVM